VAGQWRIRHKLMLGLGLVVAVMAILLAGTVTGLLSYRDSMNSMESKLGELTPAQEFKTAVLELERVDPRSDPTEQLLLLKKNRADAEKALGKYEVAFELTVSKGRLPREDRHTAGFVQLVKERLAHLNQEIDDAARDRMQGMRADSGDPPSVRRDTHVDGDIKQLVNDAKDLESGVYDELSYLKRDARSDYTISFWVVGTTSVLSVLLMAGLLRFYYRWTFDPVRDLMQGVARVAEGNFEHSIEVQSGDEMHDLAVAFNDMTGRLREMYRDLAHQVNERSRQLVRSERLASVGFLAAGVAHEINNPLASIAFCSEALEARLGDVLTKASRMGGRGATEAEVILKYLKMIQQEAFRCKDITQRLLEFSRAGERRREPTELGELIQSVLDVTQHLQNHKGKQIVFEPAAKVTAWVNAQEIKSVVLNLVVNALDSMDEGGALTIGLRARDGRAEVVFQDTGCGMTAEVLENIFEPFFTQSRTGKGTGLGLTISHRIITGHGGDIEAASAGPGRGSTFTVRLPLQPAADQGGKEQDEAEVGSPESLFRRRRAA
jgi:signal transduction histidine kinase